jgi:V/A-type H+/Na+-transporting ATPase subunit D
LAKYQFNKTELQRINKQLNARLNALPTLKNKESALRAEIQKYKRQIKETIKEIESENLKLKETMPLFSEYRQKIVSIENVNISLKKIAGVRIPILEDIIFKANFTSLFNLPTWIIDGTKLLEKISELNIKLKIQEKRIEILEWARKKTTQKVNLYEKVQIPEFQDAILKIKRYLADEENLDRAGQKIVKRRIEQANSLAMEAN